MIYTVKNNAPDAEIDLKGRFTFADYSTFREITQLFDTHSSRNCVFDLRDLEFIDSAGLGMLLIARDKMSANSGEVTLKGAQGQVRKMLDLGRLETLFKVE